jgi:diguanylate cyclase (GGDEF)-like protein
MAAQHDWAIDSGAARLRAFQLIQNMQTGDTSAAAELAELTSSAEGRGWPHVVRVGLFGRAVQSWITQTPTLTSDVEAVIETGRRDGDDCTRALGLAMRAAFVSDGAGPASATFDQDLARAVVILRDVHADALELISAHTACGIAFDYRSLWELGDEQYAAALGLAGEAEPGLGDTLLAAVMFNRAEAHVSWASRLYQLGDTEALGQRWRSWSEVATRSVKFAMPPAWDVELATLGHLMAALSGIDVGAEVTRELANLGPEPAHQRSAGHLKLARAVALVRHPVGFGEDLRRATVDALGAVDADAFPLLHDLALYLAAEAEASTGRPFGLRLAQRQIRRRWDDRMAQLSSMRSRIASERMRRELHRVSLEVTRDDLTGIGNRRALAAFTADLDRRAVDDIGLIMVDVDQFKDVNDSHGHHAGDAVLARIARILEQTVRPADLAVRLGGDEFMVVVSGVDLGVTHQRADAIMQAIDRHPWGDVKPGLRVTVSMGVAAGRRLDLDSVWTAADRAVYESKRAGGHRVTARGPTGPG